MLKFASDDKFDEKAYAIDIKNNPDLTDYFVQESHRMASIQNNGFADPASLEAAIELEFAAWDYRDKIKDFMKHLGPTALETIITKPIEMFDDIYAWYTDRDEREQLERERKEDIVKWKSKMLYKLGEQGIKKDKAVKMVEMWEKGTDMQREEMKKRVKPLYYPFNPVVEPWKEVKAVMKAKMTPKRYDEVMDKISVDLEVDKDERDNPALGFVMGLTSGLPLIEDLIHWKGEGAESLERTIPHYLGMLTGYGLLLILTSKQLAKTNIYQNVFGVESGLVARFLEPLRQGSQTSALSGLAFKMGKGVVDGMQGAAGYSTATFIRKSAHHLMTDTKWDEEDTKDLLRSIQIGGGMSAIGGHFVGKLWPYLGKRAAEEAMQIGYGAMLGLAQLQEEKGYLSKEDMGIALMYEFLELGPELMLPAAMGMMGKSYDIETRATLEQGKLMLQKSFEKLLGHTDADLSKQGRVKEAAKMVQSTYKQMSETAKKAEKKVDMRDVNHMVKDVVYEVNQELKDYKDYRVKYGIKEDIYTKLRDNPEMLNMAKQLDIIYNGLENVTLERVREAVLTGVLEAKVGKYSLQDPLGNRDKMIDDIWWDVQRIQEKEKLYPEGHDDRLAEIRERIIKYRVPIKTSDGTLEAELGRDATEYGKHIDDDLTPEDKVMTDDEFDRFIQSWTREWLGHEVKYDDMPKRWLDQIEVDLNMMDKMGEAWAYVEKMHYIDVKDNASLDKVNSSLRHYTIGLTKLTEEFGTADLLAKFKTADIDRYAEYMLINDDIRRILHPFGKFGIFTGYNMHNEAMKLIDKYLGTSEKYTLQNLQRDLQTMDKPLFIPMEVLEPVVGEYQAYWETDAKSKYFKGKDKGWNTNGLRDAFNIPAPISVKNYFPIIKDIIKGEDIPSVIKKIESVHKHKPRKYGGEGIDPEAWDKEGFELGHRAIDMYLSRMLNEKHFDQTLKEWMMREMAADKAGKPWPKTVKKVFHDFLMGLKGQPSDIQTTMENTLYRVLKKAPGILEPRDVNKWVNGMLSFVYAGGLGFRVSSAVKNLFQGPMNNPPGMSSMWWIKGLYQAWTSPAHRRIAEKHGIYRMYAVPGLYSDMSNKLSATMQQSLKLFTFVDRYCNRIPVYLGARAQMEHYFNTSKAKGIEKIALGQPKGIRPEFNRLGQRLEAYDKMWREAKKNGEPYWDIKERFDSEFDRLANMYGFLQQANSNWEYGRFGRPHYLGNVGGRATMTFLSWPTWYYGTYIPSLLKYNKKGLFEHIVKGGFIIYLMERFFSMNMKPWLLAGPMPMRPYGPTIQVAAAAAEVVQAWNYGHEQWRTQAMQRLKRSSQVFVPGGYAVYDWVALIRELQKDLPAFDSRTGMLQYEPNYRKAFADFMGIYSYDEMNKAADLLRDNMYMESERIAEKYGMRPQRRKKRKAPIGGVKGIRGL